MLVDCAAVPHGNEVRVGYLRREGVQAIIIIVTVSIIILIFRAREIVSSSDLKE